MSSDDRRVALVTGASSGIGAITARGLFDAGYHVFLACRSQARTQPLLASLNRPGEPQRAEFLPLDLGDLSSVHACADAFIARGLPLHCLVANAGVAGARGLTQSGFEWCFGTCHIGHFLLVQRLMARLREAAPARVVVLSSKAHRHARGIDFKAVRRPTVSTTGLPEYAVAKLANLLFAVELGRRYGSSGVRSYAVHPGVVATDIWRNVPAPLRWIAKRFMLSAEQGAATSLHCAMDPVVGRQNGLYYSERRIATPSPLSQDEALARELWQRSEAWVA